VSPRRPRRVFWSHEREHFVLARAVPGSLASRPRRIARSGCLSWLDRHGHGGDMANHRYDAIVVGARCAGSPTAMLLARQGHRVLVVDRATFPSDTVSTHVVHPPGAAALARWGLIDRLTATGCPPMHTYAFDFGPFTLSGSPGTKDAPVAYCARRTVLDKVLVDAAAEAGAEIREGFRRDHGRCRRDEVIDAET